ncbi:MAG: SCF ubiquitin ligase complex subunit cdc4 [Chrysothrix sp. TS-e1954]|nr:MAG: SCF ubiquitin ligase complex subunit cdc4 [Chrysothrix sp. TS-e1954]
MESPKSPTTAVRSRTPQAFTPSSTTRVERRPSMNPLGLGTPTYSKDVDQLHSTVGQVSFAPTTKTTVITTTTTTTTSFPPFVMKAPRNLGQRNPEKYPLAASSTPQAIRKLRFDIGGQTAYFEEAVSEATDQNIEHEPSQTAAQPSASALRGVWEYTSPNAQSPSASSPVRCENESASSPLLEPQQQADSRRNRSATPISIPDATEVQSFHRRNSQPSRAPYQTRRQHRHVTKAQMIGESHEETELSNASLPFNEESSRPRSIPRGMRHRVLDREHAESSTKSHQQQQPDSKGFMTPVLTQPPPDPFAETLEDAVQQRRPALPTAIDTSPVQDASLPSPSLSPITAASTLNRLHGGSRLQPTAPVDRPATRRAQNDATCASERLHALSNAPDQLELPPVDRTDFANQQLPTPGLTDVPQMLDTFDQMPDNMKTYVMYQLLRRCAKATLHFVKNTVDPALRINFLDRLPLELSLQVLKCLDAKSMCRAAQVSRKWRSIVDSDERAWKDLMATDGFKLGPTEVERAIREGWGWQMPTRVGQWDVDLSQPANHANPSPSRSGCFSVFQLDPSVTPNSSSKRKRKAGRQTNCKKQKHKVTATSVVPTTYHVNTLDSAYGPNAYANAAALAVPDPGIGLQSIRSLHLFKSLYRRHHHLKSSWMHTETKPLHLAFRAHQRHVVTCLQFDQEKILTGSDDSNIDIYDTKTGATVKRLQGHDGGVWALEYRGSMLVSGSTDRSVRVWDMRDGRMLHVFGGHTSTVRCLQILEPVKVGEVNGVPVMRPKKPLIITGSRDSTCRVWRLPALDDRPYDPTEPTYIDEANPYFVRTLQGHTSSVRAIAAHGDTLVSGSYDSTVRVWKISTGEAVHRLQGHGSKVYSVVLDHARNRCISGSMDCMVKVWDLETGSTVFTLTGHSSLVGLLDLKDDVLVSAAADATLRIWEPETGRCKKVLRAHSGAITCFMHDGQKIVSGSDRTLKMWDTETGKCSRDLLTDLSGVWQVKFDERRCIAAVQRNDWTYIEVLDFGASGDGVPDSQLGRRIAVDSRGREMTYDTDVTTFRDAVEVDP